MSQRLFNCKVCKALYNSKHMVVNENEGGTSDYNLDLKLPCKEKIIYIFYTKKINNLLFYLSDFEMPCEAGGIGTNVLGLFNLFFYSMIFIRIQFGYTSLKIQILSKMKSSSMQKKYSSYSKSSKKLKN